MKKIFEIPEMEVVRFVEADIVVCSGCCTSDCSTDCNTYCSDYNWSSYDNTTTQLLDAYSNY